MNIRKKSCKRFSKKKYLRQSQTGDQVVKRRILIGPWKNVAEFKTVCNWLYGPDSNVVTRKSALDRMKIWIIRRSTLCPAPILATSTLLDVQLKDETNAANLSEEDLRKLYAFAFMRFFNFISSVMQMTNNVRSMYEIAKELDLASFVVDIRHACAHGQIIPPIMVLRNTAKYCMQWVYEYYWQHQLDNMRDVDASELRHREKTELDEAVIQLIDIYDTALDVHMKGAATIKLAKRHVHGKRFQNLKAYYMEKECTSISAIFDHIAQKLNYFMKGPTNYYNKHKDLSDTCIEGILKMNYFFNLNELELTAEKDFSNSQEEQRYHKDLERLLNVTQSFFCMLALNDLLTALLEALLDIAENPVIERKRRLGAGFWSWQIVKGFIAFRKCKSLYKDQLDANASQEGLVMCDKVRERRKFSMSITNVTDHLRELLVFSGIDRKTTLILSVTIHRPWVWLFERPFVERHLQNINCYTKPVMKRIVELTQPKLNESELKTFLNLIETYLPGGMATKNSKTNDLKNSTAKIFTVHDVLAELNSIAANKEMDEKVMQQLAQVNETIKEDLVTSYGVWSVVEDDPHLSWKTCPLGRLPWE